MGRGTVGGAELTRGTSCKHGMTVERKIPTQREKLRFKLWQQPKRP